TLVENAIKHGVATRVGGGMLSVDATIQDGHLLVTVCNPGTLQLPAAEKGAGYGLRNIRQRLHLLYGATADLSLHQANEDKVCVTLKVPTQRAAVGTQVAK